MPDEQAPKRYKSVLKEFPFEIENAEGVVEAYTLKELKGVFRDRFLNAVSKKMVFNEKGMPVKGSDFTGSCSDLLSLCIYDSKGILVPANVIQEWPVTMQQDLFKEAMKLSALGEGAREEAEKNSQESGSPGSS